MSENTQININGTGNYTLKTAGKYCDRDIDVNVQVDTPPMPEPFEPSGAITITENGTHNVYDYAEAEVDVPTYEEELAAQKRLEDSILDGSITAYFNNRITAVTGRNYIFGDCVNLQSVDMPNVTDVKGNAFRGCSALTSVNLPKLTKVDTAGFLQCAALTRVDFPFVTRIESSGFYGCSALKTLILRSETVCVLGGTNVLQGTAIAKGTGYVYVPDALVDAYKTASNWTTHANQIKGISELEGEA